MALETEQIRGIVELGEWAISKGVNDPRIVGGIAELRKMLRKRDRKAEIKKKREMGVPLEFDNFEYLYPLSQELQEMIIGDVKAGKKNLYHSSMAVIYYKLKNNENASLDECMETYFRKNDIPKEREENIKELISYCYKKTMDKRKDWK